MRGKKSFVEQQYGGELRDILIRLFEEYGSCQAVADELEVSYVTIRNWMSDLGLEMVTRLVPAVRQASATTMTHDSSSAMRALFDLAEYIRQ